MYFEIPLIKLEKTYIPLTLRDIDGCDKTENINDILLDLYRDGLEETDEIDGQIDDIDGKTPVQVFKEVHRNQTFYTAIYKD